MMHECPRCGYTTNYITNLKNHVTTKTLCEPLVADISLDTLRDELFSKKKDNAYECKDCHKTFKSPITLKNHAKVCKSKSESVELNTKLMKEMIGLIKELIKKERSTTINNNTINNIQNIALTGDMSEFLHEKYDYISDDYIMRCAKKLDNGLVDFIKEIRFNPQHPENMNVKMHVKRDKTLYVYKDGKWTICDAKWTLEEMIIHGAKIIHQRFLSISDQEKLLDDFSSESKIQTWLLSILPRDNDRVMGRLSKILYAVILNNQNLLVMEPVDEGCEMLAQ